VVRGSGGSWGCRNVPVERLGAGEAYGKLFLILVIKLYIVNLYLSGRKNIVVS
jgi:hypothetical protein